MTRPRLTPSAALGARGRIACLLAALVLAACASAPDAPVRHKYAKRGFKGKDCEMTSPSLPVELMSPRRTVRIRARARFVDGEVASVRILSGPKAYREPVIEAMKQYSCKGELTFVADQTFVFGVAR